MKCEEVGADVGQHPLQSLEVVPQHVFRQSLGLPLDDVEGARGNLQKYLESITRVTTCVCEKITEFTYLAQPFFVKINT
jgi:hypothetical protein